MPTQQELESQIATLKAEIERLKAGVSLMTMGGAKSISGTGEKLSLHGLEEMILVVDQDGKITWLNDRMAQLLGVAPNERSKVLGNLVSDLKVGPLSEVINSLYGAIRESKQESCIMEREFPDLTPDQLPSLANRKVKDVPLLRFNCVMTKGKIQIVATDMTHTHWLEKNFSRYVSPRVMEQMQTVPEDELMRTEKREATVFFADLSGFTRACQQLSPEEVVDMVNSFLTIAVSVVEKYDGMVDKFVGDEIMAVFGVPLPMNDHALKALLTAHHMMEFHQRWQEERKKKGLIAPGIHIGIATGEVIVGNIGTSNRVDYTVLGHTVNLASRLCGDAEEGEIFTIRSTHNSAREAFKSYRGSEPVPHFHFEPRGMKTFHNILQPVEVISVKS